MKRLWNIVPRWARVALVLLSSMAMVIVVAVAGTWWYFHPAVVRTDGVVYGQRHGHDLTMDVIYHGDADTLVPLEQSEWFRDRAREVNATVQLIVHPNGKHGWLTMVWDIRKFADWFDRYLRAAKQ